MGYCFDSGCFSYDVRPFYAAYRFQFSKFFVHQISHHKMSPLPSFDPAIFYKRYSKCFALIWWNVFNIVCTLLQRQRLYYRQSQQKAWHKNADRNIKRGSLSNIEYKWAYFTLQSSANQQTDFSICNKSFPFRRAPLLRHCLILCAIEGRNKLVYIAKKGAVVGKHHMMMKDGIYLTYWR